MLSPFKRVITYCCLSGYGLKLIWIQCNQKCLHPDLITRLPVMIHSCNIFQLPSHKKLVKIHDKTLLSLFSTPPPLPNAKYLFINRRPFQTLKSVNFLRRLTFTHFIVMVFNCHEYWKYFTVNVLESRGKTYLLKLIFMTFEVYDLSYPSHLFNLLVARFWSQITILFYQIYKPWRSLRVFRRIQLLTHPLNDDF